MSWLVYLRGGGADSLTMMCSTNKVNSFTVGSREGSRRSRAEKEMVSKTVSSGDCSENCSTYPATRRNDVDSWGHPLT